MSEPNAHGRVAYKIHMTTAAPQLPSRETDARRAAELIYRSVIKKFGNPCAGKSLWRQLSAARQRPSGAAEILNL
jgi:hypothetical protein